MRIVNPIELLSNQKVLFEYDENGNLVYIGKNRKNARENDNDWYITKFIYDDDGNLISIYTFICSWSDKDGHIL